MNVLDHEKLHQKYFEELSRIPRASFKEERVSDYLEDFARTRGLDYKRDTIGNVVIYKPASAGYEDHGAVILQAHTDMVCEKNADCTHDFDRDPIDLYIENGILKARGTTLGADDGMGCAYMPVSYTHLPSIFMMSFLPILLLRAFLMMATVQSIFPSPRYL